MTHYWHGYQAEVPELVEDESGVLGPALAFTVMADTTVPQEDAPPTLQGTVFGRELTFNYVTTWDHEPSEKEKEAVQPVLRRPDSEEKEQHDNAGTSGEPD